MHAALFAPAAGKDEAWLQATWSGRRRRPGLLRRASALLVTMCDELHDTGTLTDGDERGARRATYTPAHRVELTCLVGFYHLVSFCCGAFGLEPEPWAAAPPAPELDAWRETSNSSASPANDRRGLGSADHGSRADGQGLRRHRRVAGASGWRPAAGSSPRARRVLMVARDAEQLAAAAAEASAAQSGWPPTSRSADCDERIVATCAEQLGRHRRARQQRRDDVRAADGRAHRRRLARAVRAARDRADAPDAARRAADGRSAGGGRIVNVCSSVPASARR